jgi:hypothetical protein
MAFYCFSFLGGEFSVISLGFSFLTGEGEDDSMAFTFLVEV